MNESQELSAGLGRLLHIPDLPEYSRFAYCASLCEHEHRSRGRQWPQRTGDLPSAPGGTRGLCVRTRSAETGQDSPRAPRVHKECSAMTKGRPPSCLGGDNKHILKANKLQQLDGWFVSMLHSLLLCSLVPSVSGVMVKLVTNTFLCVLLCQGLVFLHDKCSVWFPWLALWEWYVCVDWKYTKLLRENGLRKLTPEWLNEK